MAGLPQLEKSNCSTCSQARKKDNPGNYRLVDLALVPGKVRLEGDDLKIISSSPMLMQGQLQRLSRIVSRQVLSISQDGDFTASLGNPVQWLTLLRVQKKEKNLAASSSCPQHQVLNMLVRYFC